MKKLNLIGFLAAALLSLATPALAQSTCPYIVYGAVLTAAQWNACFAAKQNNLGYTPLSQAGGTMTGELITAASGTLNAGLNLQPGSAPGSPNNGDLWVTAVGLYAQANGSTVGPMAGTATAQTFTAAQTFTNGDFLLKGSTSGAMTLKAPAIASTYVDTFPAYTGSVVATTTSSPAQGDILYFNGSSQWVDLGYGTSGQVLTTNGASANPSWSNASAGNALFGTATGNVANDIVTLSNTTTGVQDSGIAIQTKGAWTPADASSSSLVFTINGTNACNNSTHVCANYTLNGNLVTVYAAFFVSSNSSGNPGSVSGLPFNTANKVYGVMPLGAVVGNAPFAKTAFAFTTQNSSTIRFLYQDGTNVLNSAMSTYEITFTGTYPLN